MNVKKPTGPEILLVEDSLTQAVQLRWILEERGYRVRHVRNGQEALAALDEAHPLAVVSDVNMPEMDGYELCRRVSAKDDLAGVPIILLTSLADTKDVVLALAAGADYFFTKPCDEQALASRLQNLQTSPFRRESRAGTAPIEVRLPDGSMHSVAASPLQTINLLVSTYESAITQNRRLQQAELDLRQLNESLESRVKERTVEITKTNEALQAEISARMKIESRLREQAELIDKAREVIITTDTDFRIRFWNPGAERLLGWTTSDMVGRDLGVVLSLNDVGGENSIGNALRNNHDWRGTLTSTARGGAQINLEISLTVLRDDAGRPVGWMSVGTDVTEKKKLEEQFLRAQRLESIGMLAAGIAHDLNNVLAPIGMASALLRPHLAASSAARFLDTLDQSVERGSGLVRQILGFAHGVGGERRLVQLKHIVRDITAVITQTFPKSITLSHRVPTDLWPVLGNATQMHQVLLNLCVNARDAMPQGGKLTVNCENIRLTPAEAAQITGARPGAFLRLEVSDTGTGIPPEVLQRIWEPFFTTKAADRGTGLGLSTVRGIVDTHEGFITLDTVLGRGTTFRVYLPAAEVEEVTPTETVAEPAANGSGQTVLVVDDEIAIREAVAAILSESGYTVATAENGAEAADLFAATPGGFAVVITDLDMPKLNGEQLSLKLRAANPQQRIVIMSGLMDSSGRHPKHVGIKADGHLVKPFVANDLLRTVEKLVQRAPGS